MKLVYFLSVDAYDRCFVSRNVSRLYSDALGQEVGPFFCNVCASKLPASKLHYWQFQRKDQTNRKHNSWSKDHAVTFLDMGYQKLANSLQKNS